MKIVPRKLRRFVFALYATIVGFSIETAGFAPRLNKVVILSKKAAPTVERSPLTQMFEMKRPILDQLASTLFKLETIRVQASSIPDEKGREGEPMEWSEQGSFANKFSAVLASNSLAYLFKQWVADIVAGEFEEETVCGEIDDFIASNSVAVFSFTTCPFCRRAKDHLDESGVAYSSLELDELEGNRGNEIRAVLGRRTGRTSVPSIFVGGQYIGGCNDGPGLLPLAKSGELNVLLNKTFFNS